MIFDRKEQVDKICELKLLGMTHRDISEQVFGKRTAASTVHYILKAKGLVGGAEITSQNGSQGLSRASTPRILTLDIETAPVIGKVWGLWQNNVSLNQIVNDWYILSWAAKWLHQDYVMYEDKRNSWNDSDDKQLLQQIWDLLDEADIIVTQNGKKFDAKKLNARFIINGMKPPSSYKHIDTLQLAKRHFGFTSNKLEYMTDKLCKRYKKLTHGKFPGMELWNGCMSGNLDAWKEMEEYNIYDVLSLEELLFILAPWSNILPNINVYHDEEDTRCLCGKADWEHSGYSYTNLSKFDRFTCQSCGSERRGRVNLLTKEKKSSLLMNAL